jgi:hypothetical protein
MVKNTTALFCTLIYGVGVTAIPGGIGVGSEALQAVTNKPSIQNNSQDLYVIWL